MSASFQKPLSELLSPEQQELGELLMLAIRRGTSCHLQGNRQQIQPLLHQLESELRAAGHRYQAIHLAGVTRDELPRLLADQLGFGLPSHLPQWEVWQQLSDFLRGARQSDVQTHCIWWDLELLDHDMLAACSRILHMSEGLGPHILLTEAAPRNELAQLLHNLDLVELHLGEETSGREHTRSDKEAIFHSRPASIRPVPVR